MQLATLEMDKEKKLNHMRDGTWNEKQILCVGVGFEFGLGQSLKKEVVLRKSK